MSTRPITPRADLEGSLGLPDFQWQSGFFGSLNVGGISIYDLIQEYSLGLSGTQIISGANSSLIVSGNNNYIEITNSGINTPSGFFTFPNYGGQVLSTQTALNSGDLLKFGFGGVEKAISNSDYLTPNGNGAGLTNLNANNITSGVVPALRGGAGSINGILKANGSGLVSQAIPNSDYLSVVAPSGANPATGSISIPAVDRQFLSYNLTGNTTLTLTGTPTIGTTIQIHITNTGIYSFTISDVEWVNNDPLPTSVPNKVTITLLRINSTAWQASWTA